MRKLMFFIALMFVSSIAINATTLGDIIAQAKGVNAAMVAEMRPEFAPNGLPIESGYIVGLPTEGGQAVVDAIAAIDKSLVFSIKDGEKVYVDAAVDPCEILLVVEAQGRTTLLFMQGSADMIELLKAN